MSERGHHLVPCDYCGGRVCLFLSSRKECSCPYDGWQPQSGHFVCARCWHGWSPGLPDVEVWA